MTHISTIRRVIEPPKKLPATDTSLIKRTKAISSESSDFKLIADHIVAKGIPRDANANKAFYLFLKDAFKFLQDTPHLSSEKSVDKYLTTSENIQGWITILGRNPEEVANVFNLISEEIGQKNNLPAEDVTDFLTELGNAISERTTYNINMCNNAPSRKKFTQHYKITRTEAVLNKLKAIDPKDPKIKKTITLLETRLDKLTLLDGKDLKALSMGKKKESNFKSFFATIFRFINSMSNNKRRLSNDVKAFLNDKNKDYALPLSDDHLLEEVLLQTLLKETFKDTAFEGQAKAFFNMSTITYMNEKGAWGSFKTRTEFFTDSGHPLSFESNFTSSKTALDLKSGYSSMDRSTSHLSNAWVSEFDTAIDVLNPKHIRMATLSAFGVNAKFVEKLLADNGDDCEVVAKLYPEIKDTTKLSFLLLNNNFKQAALLIRGVHNSKRATELQKMIASEFKTEITQLPKDTSMHIVNVNLMTPDDVRALMAHNNPNAGNEKLMTFEQVEALKTLETTPLHGHAIRNLNFTFGVNRGGFSRLSIINGTRAVKEKNKASMAILLGDDLKTGLVGEYLTKLNAQINNEADQNMKTKLELKKALITELASQVDTIWTKESFLKEGHEPYKMVSRLTLLTDLLDSTITVINCKSGKDRTSQLDAEVKFLMAKFIKDGVLAEPDAKKNDEDQRLMRNIIMSSGNFEIQEMNTGARGYKLKGVKALIKQIGGDKKSYHGLSGYVKA